MEKELVIKTNEKLLTDLQTRSSEFSISVQEYVTDMIERDLYPECFPQVSEDQRAKIWEKMQSIWDALGDIHDILQEDYVKVEKETGTTMAP